MSEARKNFTKGRSLQFKITFYVLLIILLFSAFVLFFTIRNFRSYVEDSAASKSNEISKQIVYNYENYIASIIETFNIVVEELDNANVKEAVDETKDYFESVLSFRTDINNITLFNIDGSMLVSTNENFNSPSDIVRTMFWFQEPILQPTAHYFSPPYTTESGENIIFATKYLDYNFGEDQGVLMIELSSDKIVNLAKNTNLGKYGQIVILNNVNSLIFYSGDSVNDEMLSSIRNQSLGTSNVVLEGEQFTLSIKAKSE